MEEISSACPCKRKSCERRADCESCRAHHEAKGSPPYCERPGRKTRR